ncbi:MAG: YihY/virulence factor BrkB family protein [Scytonematopsis contorta HA4267-MV1]|nr:YihY/virulence factor BrkB family protein [Scytonematopsis contorta HA4267-MV1]
MLRFLRLFCYINCRTIKKTIVCTVKRRLLGMASEIAFNAMLSLFPAILVVLTAIGLFQDSLQDTFRQMATGLAQVAPKEAMVLIEDFATREIAQSRNGSLFSLSFAVAIWTASGAFSTAMTAFDVIHQTPSEKIRPFWKAKLISIGLTISIVILLVVASFLIFISDLLLKSLAGENTYFLFLLRQWQLFRWPLALFVVAIAFSLAYRWGPSYWRGSTPIIPGAILAAILWAIVSALFRSYVEHFGNYNKAYGAVGTVIILMLWLWMSAAVVLVGDQLNVIIGEEMRAGKSKKI